MNVLLNVIVERNENQLTLMYGDSAMKNRLMALVMVTVCIVAIGEFTRTADGDCGEENHRPSSLPHYITSI